MRGEGNLEASGGEERGTKSIIVGRIRTAAPGLKATPDNTQKGHVARWNGVGEG